MNDIEIQQIARKLHLTFRDLPIKKARVSIEGRPYNYYFMSYHECIIESLRDRGNGMSVSMHSIKALPPTFNRNVAIFIAWDKGMKKTELAYRFDLSTTTINSKIKQITNRLKHSSKWRQLYRHYGIDVDKYSMT